MANFDFSEFKELARDIDDSLQKWDTFLEDFIILQGLRWMGDTKRNTPVDTGILRSSWMLSMPRIVTDDVEIDLFNNMEYALGVGA